MSPRVLTVCLLSLGVVACGATRGDELPAGASSASAASVAASADAADAGARRGDSWGLELWADPDFRRRFAESYLAEADTEPRVTSLERERLGEVANLMAAEKVQDALELLARMGGEGASAAVDFTRANIHLAHERLDEAVAGYEAAIAKHARYLRAWRNLGLTRVRQGEHAAAAPALTRVIELGGGDALTYGLLGYAHGSLGDELSAESAFRMASLLDPSTLDWKLGMARAFFEQQRYAETVALCEGLIAERPERADLWLLQANAHLGSGHPLRAAENLEFVDELGASTAASLTMLGDIYANGELPDLAASAYLRAMDQDPPPRVERILTASKVLLSRGALAETRTLVERIEALYGESLAQAQQKDVLHLRARLAAASGAAGSEEADILRELVALDPLDGEALLLLGQYYARAGDAEEAVFAYERAAGMDRYEAEARLRHAQLLVGQGLYAEALPLLRRAQAIDPRENVQQFLEQVERGAQGR